MKRYNGNDKVQSGFYLSTKRWDVENIEENEGLLPGSESEQYIRVPLPVMLVAGPAAGFLFVVFLPLIGFLMLLYVLGGKALNGLTVAKAMVARKARAGELKVHAGTPGKPLGTMPFKMNATGQGELSGQDEQNAQTLRKAS